MQRALAPTAAFVLAVVVLGPALGPGLVLSYDMVFVPDAGLTPFVLGAGVPAPRAVPSDLLVALLSLAVPTWLVQKALLVGLLAGAGLGCGRLTRELLDDATPVGVVTAAECVAVVAGVWNPFTAERLVLGQWTVLLGLAVTPWAVRAALRVRAGSSLLPTLGWLALAAAGGATSTLLVVVPVLVVLLWPSPGGRRAGTARQTLTTLLVVAGLNAAWWLPAVARAGDAAATRATTAFAPRADTPFGLLGSVLGTGGVWNTAVIPAERGVALAAGAALLATVAAVVLGAPRLVRAGSAGGGRGLLWSAIVLLGVVVLSGWFPTRDAVAETVAAVPGGGLLRDAQKLLSAWTVVVAVCTGLATARLLRSPGASRRALVAVLAAAPLVTLPGFAWGASGQLHAVTYPSDVTAVRTALHTAPEGPLAVLPWGQFRRFAWNGHRVSLDPAPRMFDRPVLVDDALPLRSGSVPGEDPRATRVRAALAAGVDPVRAVRRAGARLLLIERRTGLAVPSRPASLGQVLYSGRDLVLVDLGPSGRAGPDGRLDVAGRWGLALSLAALMLLAVVAVAAGGRARHRGGGTIEPPGPPVVATLRP